MVAMHASRSFTALWTLYFLFSGSTLAFPNFRRQDDAGLSPWITIDPSGIASTVTPVLTTISGTPTTLNAQPATATATGTNSDTSQPTPTGSSFSICHNPNGAFSPFCAPTNGSTLHTGRTYYITWDASSFPRNASVIVVGNYINETVAGEQAFQSPELKSTQGWHALAVDDAWRLFQAENFLDLYIATTGGRQMQGPRVRIAKAAPDAVVPGPTRAPSGPALYIALPAVFGFVVLCVVGGFWWNRKARVVGLGNVMGRRRGYGVGKSRRQRMGLRKKGAIQLQERSVAGEGAKETSFRDDAWEAEQGRRIRDSDLGSLANTPTRPEFGDAARGNVFRDEMRRQEGERRF